MAKSTVAQWSTTAANNTDVGGIGIQGSNTPANLDDAMREIMAQIAQFRQDATFVTLRATSVLLDGNPVSLFQPGMIMPYAGGTAPSGWLFCYGQAVSRTTYADLFAAIGTAYGTGNGSTTFNLPDYRGRVLAGKDNMGGTPANRLTSAGGVDGTTLGAAGGSQTHTLTLGQIPAHKHNVGVTVSGTANTRSREEYAVQNGGSRLAGTNGQNVTGSTSDPTNLSLTVNVTEADRGSGQAHPIVQPTIVTNFLIKT